MNNKNVLKVSLVFFFILLAAVNAYGQSYTSFAYRFDIKNSGNALESYNLSLDRFYEYAAFSQNPIIVEPEQSQIAYAYLTIPCSIDGSYTPNLIAKAESTGIITKIPFQIDIKPCFGYSIKLGNDIDLHNATPVSFAEHEGGYSICNGDSRAMPILAVNNKNASTKLNIGVKGEKWGYLSAKSLEIGANQAGAAYLILTPPIEKEGKYSFILNVGDANNKFSSEINVDVKKCYSFGVNIEKDKDRLCGGEEKNYSVNVENNGNKLAYLNLTAEGAEWAAITRNFIGLKPDGEGKLELIINPAANESGSFNIKVSASLTENSGIKEDDGINVEVKTKEDCYKADVEIVTKRITYKPTAIPITIKNSGIKKADYSISLEAPSWVSVNPSFLTINPGKGSSILLNTAPSEETAEGAYNLTLKLSAEGIVYSKKIELQLKKENLAVKKIKEIIWYIRYYIYLALILAVIILLIYGPIKSKIIKIKGEIEEAREREKEKKEKEETKEEEKTEEIKKAELTAEGETKGAAKSRKRRIGSYILLIWSIIFALGVVIYSFISFDLIGRIKNIKIAEFFPVAKGIFGQYLYYIIGGAVLLLLIAILLIIRKIKRKKTKKGNKKEAKKEAAKKKKRWVKILVGIFAAIIALGAAAYGLAYYGLIQNIKDFLVVYYNYIIAGIIILIILISAVKSYKPKQKSPEKNNGK